MSSVGRKKGLLEVFKFTTYVAIPVVMMYAFANNSENLEKIIRNVYWIPLSVSVIGASIAVLDWYDLCFTRHMGKYHEDFTIFDTSMRSYVVYPPEGPRPPSGDEIRDLIKKNKATPS